MKEGFKPYARGYIEITNVCGLSCTFCPPSTRTKGKMSDELFRVCLSSVAPLVKEICFHVLGDPLAHPHLLEFLDRAHEEGSCVVLTTAGHLLTQEKFPLLVHPAVKQVNVSLSSFEVNAQRETLREYLSHQALFAIYAKEDKPDLYINWRLWNQGKKESEPFTQEVLAFVEERFGVFPTTLKKSFPIFGRFYLHFERRFEWPSLDLSPFQTEGFCHGLKNQFGILVDGTVVPCCLDAKGAIALGNIRETPLEEILSSPRAVAMREGFKAKKLVEPLCQTCGYIQRFT